MDIKKFRLKLRLSQEQFAHKIGVTRVTVYRWEEGKTKISPLAQKAIESIKK